MGNVEMHDLSPVRADERKDLNISRSVNSKLFKRHLSGEYNDTCLLEIPWGIRDSVSLYERIDASFNQIQEIPVEIPLRLPHLNYLNFSYNKLTTLPESFGLLFHLKTVILNNNLLTGLPESFVHLVKLEKVDLTHNCLRQLPDGLGNMESLKRLSVSHNKLTELPVSLGSSRILQIILAKHNRLETPPQTVCEEGSASTIAFLRKAASRGGTPIVVKPKVNIFPRIRGNQLTFSVNNSQSALAEYIQSQTNTINTPSRIKTPLLPPLDASVLDVNDLRDRILGMFYGAAIGDAIGLATENMKPDECAFHYDVNHISYSDIIRDEHRVQWKRGDWTVHFDQIALVLESIINWGGVIDELDFAKRLYEWSNQGFKELGDKDGFVVSNTITKVISDPGYLNEPHSTAKRVTERIIEEEPDAFIDNGALARCLVLGVPNFHDLSEVRNNATRICKATHVDDRCVVAGVMVASVIALLLKGDRDAEVEGIQQLIDTAKSEATRSLTNSSHKEAFEVNCSIKDYKSINIHDWRHTNHVLQTLSAGLVALLAGKDFRSSINELIMHGGNSTSNACIAGAFLGCKFGYSGLPKQWLDELREQQVTWLNARLNLLLDMMGIP